MTKIKDIVDYLEAWAPPALQESYDNSGLIVGDSLSSVNGILISLDCTEEVIQEALDRKCSMIISHHPIVFRGLKKLTGRGYVERTVISAIKNDVALYAIHTNLDNVNHGVNKKMADILGLKDTHILRPKSGTLSKLTTFIPADHTNRVLDALHQAGAGQIGEYSHCSFRVHGTGAYLPSESANPAIGSRGQKEEVAEDRVEVIFSSNQKSIIIKALKENHPYEEVAYYLHDLQNVDQEVGSGMVGELSEEVPTQEFLSAIKQKFGVEMIRHTQLVKDRIKRIAICGGSGSFLLADAIRNRADLFVSADFKYHEFFDADGKITIVDIGHYESEQFTKDLIFNYLQEKFPNIALHLSKVNTNPIKYA